MAFLSHLVFGGIWHLKSNFKLFGKELGWEETLRYFFLTASGIIQVLFGG
jgi:hypothetical protein